MTLSKGFSRPEKSEQEGNPQQQPLQTLLIVDDEVEITRSLTDQFRRLYHVVTACNADAALALMQQHQISVIVADQRMPGKTGTELLAEARMIDADAVRILLTGYADIEATIQAVNQGGIFFYLKKPWENHELEAVIGRAAEHSRLLRVNRRLVQELLRANTELEERVKERTLQLEQRAAELEDANQKISELAFVDFLTGVANRRALDETLVREVERSSRLGLPLTVVLLDIDHFKAVNDDFGHPVGDRALQAIATMLTRLVRPYDLVARYGGEEFLIMMPEAALEVGIAAADRFRCSVRSLQIAGVSRPLTASFGVAALRPAEIPTALFERVDRALYRAKQKGRNRVESDKYEPAELDND